MGFVIQTKNISMFVQKGYCILIMIVRFKKKSNKSGYYVALYSKIILRID